jgi:hypothetical protein
MLMTKFENFWKQRRTRNNEQTTAHLQCPGRGMQIVPSQIATCSDTECLKSIKYIDSKQE